MRHIGILGGTFNPIHNAHINLAIEAKLDFNLDEVWLMPAIKSAHKKDSEIVDIRHRSNMIELAIKNYPYIKYSDFEIRIASEIDKSYTYYTLKRLKEEYPDIKIYFIMGADSLYNIESWKYPEKIMSLATLLVAKRDYADKNVNLRELSEKLEAKYAADIRFISFREMHISSHDIREMFSDGEDAEKCLSKEVYQYIKDNKLYGSSNE